ncbi:MAG: PQQ-dependent sugar dehydrogenase [Methyloceanibacter sp.]|uniref:PQQ-dependent sugar dehydrogenase n=1 Tax=Methyloceanibacter sp. TaxID=1965321 RepID=UPI003D9AF56F
MATYNAETKETVLLRTATALVAGALLMFASMTVIAEERTVQSKAGPLKVETLADGLDSPWGMAFLPDGRMLVTEKVGTLRIVDKDGAVSDPIKGVPKVVAAGQGGLLDVALDPDFATNGLVFVSYSEPGDGGAGTAVARGKLTDMTLEDVKVIFRQKQKVDGGNHFGSRLVFAPDGKLFVTLGERFKFDPVQDLKSHLGKVVRINPDGSVPDDNPFVGKDDALPEIWSYGHRNVQGGAINPKTGKLWTIEFGPKGGDELNIPEPGKNYGWPVVSWGTHYDGEDIPDPPTHPEFTDAIYHWNPVISPSGMTFYTGDVFPDWRGNILIAGLSSAAIVRLTLDGDKVASEDRIAMGSRIRDVAQGPDGAVYALTDGGDGKLLRLTPGK